MVEVIMVMVYSVFEIKRHRRLTGCEFKTSILLEDNNHDFYDSSDDV